MTKKTIILLSLFVLVPVCLSAIMIAIIGETELQEFKFLEAHAAVGAPAAQPAPNEIAQHLAGTYIGTCGGSPVRTDLIVAGPDGLHGHYNITYSAGECTGLLDNPHIVDKKNVVFAWHDQFGAGTAHFVFSDDYSSFTGSWVREDSAHNFMHWVTRQNDWDGTRSDEPGESSEPQQE